MTKIIKTLALGSGGLRGIYHLSVLEVFEDLNLITPILTAVKTKVTPIQHPFKNKRFQLY